MCLIVTFDGSAVFINITVNTATVRLNQSESTRTLCSDETGRPFLRFATGFLPS